MNINSVFEIYVHQIEEKRDENFLKEKTFYEYYYVSERLREYLIELHGSEDIEKISSESIKNWENGGKNIESAKAVSKQVYLIFRSHLKIQRGYC